MAQNKKSGEDYVRKMRLQKEEELRKQKEKKKKKTIIIVTSVALVIAIILAVAIPVGIVTNRNEYNYLELKNLCNADGTQVSTNVRALDGKKVRITGYLLECTSYTRFLAGSSDAACPFSTQKYVTNVIPCVYKDGSTFPTNIKTNVPYVVYGTLHVGDTPIAYTGSGTQEIAGMVVYVERYELKK